MAFWTIIGKALTHPATIAVSAVVAAPFIAPRLIRGMKPIIKAGMAAYLRAMDESKSLFSESRTELQVLWEEAKTEYAKVKAELPGSEPVQEAPSMK